MEIEMICHKLLQTSFEFVQVFHQWFSFFEVFDNIHIIPMCALQLPHAEAIGFRN
jgi:hypothetical protein